EGEFALPAIGAHRAKPRATARGAHDEVAPTARTAHADALTAHEVQIDAALELVLAAFGRAQIDLHAHRLVLGQVRTGHLHDVFAVHRRADQALQFGILTVRAFRRCAQAEPERREAKLGRQLVARTREV